MNTVQTSLQTGQRVKEVQDRADSNSDRPFIYIYGLYSAEYAAEASEGEP